MSLRVLLLPVIVTEMDDALQSRVTIVLAPGSRVLTDDGISVLRQHQETQ